MKTIVNAVLSYGLVNVQVGVCTATSRKEVHFRIIHKDCGMPVKQNLFCPEHGTLETEQTTKGFEVVKGQIVTIDPDDLAAVKGESEKTITLTKFIDWDDVEELQMEKAYFLKPSGLMLRTYRLLSQAMQNTGTVGVGRAALWGKETPVLVYPRANGTLILAPMFCHDEVASDQEIQDLIRLDVPAQEQELADELVSMMTMPLEPEADLVTEQRRKVWAFLEAVVEGRKAEIPEAFEAPQVTRNVSEDLKRSIEEARKAA